MNENATTKPHATPGHEERLICLFLAFSTLLIYWPVRGFDFINYDDPNYVTQNPLIQDGLSWTGIVQAFFGVHYFMWHPLTTLSHMLDCQLFGLNASGHHLISVFIHTLNGILLFLLLRRITGKMWLSAAVAALFALHPLRVESVAWISERKDVLCTLFWLLTLSAYARYTEKQEVKYYRLTFLAFALGIMTKPMIVTLPFTMLLLDIWPFKRIPQDAWQSLESLRRHETTIKELFREKLIFFGLSAFLSVVTYLVQKSGGVIMNANVPLGMRVSNALVSYARYLGKLICPTDLSILYPYPKEWPMGWVLGALALLIVVTLWTVRQATRRPYLMVGWLWYLGTLVPVIGLMQAGDQAMANHYTYVPLIGILIMFVWGIDEITNGWNDRRQILLAGTTATVGACLIMTHFQLEHWQNSITVFQYAIASTEIEGQPGNNDMAHNNLGTALLERGQVKEAKAEFAKAIEINKGNYLAYYNAGNIYSTEGSLKFALIAYNAALRINPKLAPGYFSRALVMAQAGSFTNAEKDLKQAIEIDPNYAMAHYQLGNVLHDLGQSSSSILHYEKALELQPEFADGHYRLGIAVEDFQDAARALPHYDIAVQLQPDNPDYLNRYGAALLATGKAAEAIEAFKSALKVKQAFPGAENNYGRALITLNKPAEALEHFQAALKFQTNFVVAHYNMAMALDALNKPDEAIAQYKEAVQGDPSLVDAHYRLASDLVGQKRTSEAITQLEEAVRQNKDKPEVLTLLSWLLATAARADLRNSDGAIEVAERAAKLTLNRDAKALDALAAAYAEAGRYSEAVATAEKAVQLANETGQKELAAKITARLQLYHDNKPYHEPS